MLQGHPCGPADEFLSAPEPITAAEMVTQCLGDRASSAVVPWRLINCGDCPGVEIEEWHAAYKATNNSPLGARPPPSAFFFKESRLHFCASNIYFTRPRYLRLFKRISSCEITR